MKEYAYTDIAIEDAQPTDEEIARFDRIDEIICSVLAEDDFDYVNEHAYDEQNTKRDKILAKYDLTIDDFRLWGGICDSEIGE